MSLYYIYDLETFKNCFVFNGKFKGDPRVQTFEMSPRKNQRSELLSWLSYLQNCGAEMVGYNNIGFDYCFLHKLLNEIHTFDYTTAYQLCKQIIGSQQYGVNNWNVPYRERIIPQIDLVKINHFDNANKRTSLKSLQVAMRSDSVEDLPYDPDIDLTYEQMDHLIAYGIHDITETELFLNKCLHLIDFRKELINSGTLTGDVLNYSDVKIGTEYLIKKLGRAKCFVSGNTPRQTPRDIIIFKDIILPKVQYKTEEFNEVLNWFKSQKIVTKSEDPLPHHQARLAGLDFYFGVGGIHASAENKNYYSTEEYCIRDLDVTGMYVSVAVANGFYPEHLGQDFVVAYKQLQSDRGKYKKGTAMNAVLKLAGNGVFGNSDNEYSPFFDPKYPKQVTVNGQLQILQLVESLSLIPRLDLIQANTDGITVRYPRSLQFLFDIEKREWEANTGLALEEVEYRSMFIRDVNNYICVSTDGKIKRKGAYWYPIEEKDYDGVWNKDFSMMCVPKAVEQVMINNISVDTALKCVTNKFDFMLRYKTPAGAVVYIGDRPMLKTVRYYVSTKGLPMKKLAKPKGEIGQFKRKSKLEDSYFNKIMAEIGPNVWDERVHTKNKSKYEETSTNIENGWLVKECNVHSKFDWSDVNYEYYAKEVDKLIVGE